MILTNQEYSLGLKSIMQQKGAYDIGHQDHEKLVKREDKMGGNNSAIFSGANTINFTKNGDGTDTVTPMGASAQDIKTAYRKASLNA